MAKVIVHIDLNKFFIRCEEIKNPSLKGKAVAVGKDGRSGIISTCSYEARKFGVSSGMPTFKARELCPSLILCSSDYSFYQKYSKMFFNFVKRYTSIIEKASVDECYADFTEQLKGVKDVIGYFKDFQNKLFEETELMCSIGISPTKFLSKMGSDYQKPMGITIIRRRDIEKILYPLDISKMYGIGKKSEPRLRNMGINTIGDLARRVINDDPVIKNEFGKYFYTIKGWLTGYSNDVVDVLPNDPKSIGNSMTLMHDTNNYEEIKEAIKMLSYEVSERAIDEEKLGTTIQLVVKDTNFVSHNKSLTIKEATNNKNTIYSYALKLYEDNFLDMTIRLAGVTLQNLISKRDVVIQMSLFNYEEYEQLSQTKLLINKLNSEFKKPLFKRASEVMKK